MEISLNSILDENEQTLSIVNEMLKKNGFIFVKHNILENSTIVNNIKKFFFFDSEIKKKYSYDHEYGYAKYHNRMGLQLLTGQLFHSMEHY